MPKFHSEETFRQLLVEFGTLHVPATKVGEKYLALSERVLAQKAYHGQLPFPTFRASPSRKSPILADLRDVAMWLDRVRDEHQQDWRNLQ